MNKISSTTLIHIITKFLILLLLAKIIAFGIWFYLKDIPNVELQATKNYQTKYYRIDFSSMLQKQQKKVKPQKKVPKGPTIKNIILKGLYGKDNNGFAIVALKSKPRKTSIISVGEVYAGYTLSSIQLQSVVFQKNNKNYILSLQTNKKTKGKSKITKVHTQQAEEDDDEPHEVSRHDINYYSKHPREIWKNISIYEVKKGGKIIGFKVKRINKSSIFGKLGLKKGDLIIRANNIALTSYKSAFDLYNNIDKIDTMEIVVLRNNQEKELVYEIN
ncbi:General secretion pathway protein C [hydrothermal vent metagenome]|uniref:General secretion pathway protein C n=1 Tax=hydrothermal vent metagenome TaxID=652676 RepID=A0A1W1D4S5_9ZZZZ